MIIIGNKDKAIAIGIKDPKTVARFMKRQIVKDNGCVEYVGSKTTKGYGQFQTGETDSWTSVRAHRFAYALHYGIDKLPSGTDKTQKRKVLHHKCENKACVNPLHLEVVTDRFNLGQVNDKNMF